MKTSRPTVWQSTIAGAFHIPYNQAHLINPIKAAAYFAYCKTDECRLEWHLNQMTNRQAQEQAREWLKGNDD